MKSDMLKGLMWGSFLLAICVLGCFGGDLVFCRRESICSFPMISYIKKDFLSFLFISYSTGILITYIIKYRPTNKI